MSAESNSQSPEAVIEHPAIRFAREVRAHSFALPSPAQHVRSTGTETDVRKIWALYGPEKAF
jgi:hypothetical protein